MLLISLIIISIILTLGFFITCTYLNHITIYNSKKITYLKRMKTLLKDETIMMFYMCIILFLIIFITTSATYNTFIDKSNPNYYTNQK